jgi:hypothetical protein
LTRLCFVDTETTGLADHCDIWEIGLIVRHPAPQDVDTPEGVVHVDTEYSWLIRPDLTNAEPTGLRIGRYYERIGHVGEGPVGYVNTMENAHEVAYAVARLLDGVTIVGAVPDFDDRHLRRWLRANNQAGTWHHHLVDVETLAAGALRRPPPWNLDKLLAEYGLAYDEDQRHTALGDARLVRDLYDAVLTNKAVSA